MKLHSDGLIDEILKSARVQIRVQQKRAREKLTGEFKYLFFKSKK